MDADDAPAATGAPDVPERSVGVYGIGVAAKMVGTGVQNLRAYEKAGLVEPDRTDGGTRLYSADDLVRVRRVLDLLRRGLNLVGIAMVMQLEDESERLRQRRRR